MGIRRLLILATIFLIGLMLYEGLYNKEAPLMWLAATTTEYAYLRATLIGVLMTLLISSPPRSAFFRMMLASFGLTIGVGAIVLSFGHAIHLFDAVVFLEVAIIFMIEALEADLTPQKRVHLSKSGHKEIHV